MTTWINDKALDDIRRVGWHILGIEGDETTPSVVHTVGLQKTFGHPEMVMVGLKVDTMMQIVSDLGQRVADGVTISAESELNDVLEGYPVRFEEALPVAHERFLPGAHEFYGESGFKALQCLWPDKAGRFPGDRDVAATCSSVEPRLGDPEWASIYATWAFEESYVVACFTTFHVIDRSKPILRVTHDEEDGAWQFLCGTTNDPSDGRLVCLKEAVKIDPKVVELADLPVGWCAYRERPDAEWVREPNGGCADDDDQG